MPALFTKASLIAGAACVTAITGWIGWRLVESDVEARVYRDRLADLASEYRELAEQYNAAVRRTAVSELLVQGDRVWVRVRTAGGTVSVIETPVDASGEVFADFVVIDGRLWIRRVYDQGTPPERGFEVDDELIVDWADERTEVGKTVYRPLSDGRWVVEVSGDGSLGLVRIGDVPEEGPMSLASEAEPNLARGVELGAFDEWLATIDADTREVSARDVMRALVGGARRRRSKRSRSGEWRLKTREGRRRSVALRGVSSVDGVGG